MTNMEVVSKFCLKNFADIHHRRMTECKIKSDNLLQKKFEQLEKKRARNLRFIDWQQKKSIMLENARLTGYRTSCAICIPKELKNNADTKTSPNVDKPKLEASNELFKYSKCLPKSPRSRNHEEQQNPFCNQAFHEQNKFVQELFKSVGIEPEGNRSRNVGEICSHQLHERFYDSLTSRKMTILKEEINTIGLKLKQELLPKAVEKKKSPFLRKKVILENRIKYSVEDNPEEELNNHINLIQTLLRGRAYQIMMIMAKIRFEPFLRTEDAGSAAIDSENENKEIITADNVYDITTARCIGRILNTMQNELIRNEDENHNESLSELGNRLRDMKEAAEANRRQNELLERNEQEEILRQVIKIHQESSVLFAERLIDHTIQRCANEDGMNLMRLVTNRRHLSDKNKLNDKKKEVELGLLYHFMIPEAKKVIHREKMMNREKFN